jgi:hypothetical protein
MEIAAIRAAIIEINADLKRIIPEAWAMMMLTEGGHIQFSINRRQHWPIATFDIPANAEDWEARTDTGLATMREAVAEVAAKRERGEL